MFWLITFSICALVLYSLTQGAPYVPTRQRQVTAALDLMDLPKQSVVVDVGSGDGVFLKAAAQRGFHAVGIEINPILVLISRLRTQRFARHVEVVRGNAYNWHLPPETAGVFLFTAGPFVGRLGNWIRTEQARLGRPLVVVSHGFELPKEKIVKSASGCIKYVLE